MEENITRPIQDPSKIGTQGLQGADKQGVNVDNIGIETIPERRPTVGEAITQSTLQHIPDIRYIPGFGSSRYDKRATSWTDVDDLENFRSHQQSRFNKIISGTAKGGVLAATTFVQGVAGLPVGLIEWASTGSFSEGFIKNPITEMMQGINKWSEEVLPNYYSFQERTNTEMGKWYKNILNANFIGNTFIKNLGFSVGAYYSGMVWSKFLNSALLMNEARAAFKGAAALSEELSVSSAGLKAAEAAKAAAASGNIILDTQKLVEGALAAKSLKYKSLINQVAGVVTSAIGESTIEAYGAMEEYIEKKEMEFEQLINNHVAQQIESYRLSTGVNDITKEQYDAFVDNAKADLNYDEIMERVALETASMGNRVWLYNMVILTVSNGIEFGQMYAGGYRTSREAFLSSVKKGKAGLLEYTKPSKLKEVAKGALKVGISEGPFEEMQQSTAQRWGERIADRNIETYIGKKYDPYFEDEQISDIEELWNAHKDTYLSIAAWEEGYVGALTGILGVPGYNKHAKIGQGRFLQGGVAAQISEYNISHDYTKALVESFNKSIQRPERLASWQAAIARRSIDYEKLNAIKNDDKFAYQNAKHKGLINEVLLHRELGRLDDLYDYIEGVVNIDPNNTTAINEIKQLAVDEPSGKSRFHNVTDSKIVETLKSNVKETKESIDRIIEIADGLQAKAGGEISTEMLDELIWMHSIADNLQTRFENLWNPTRELMQTALSFTQSEEGVKKIGKTQAAEFEQLFSKLLKSTPLEVLAFQSVKTSEGVNLDVLAEALKQVFTVYLPDSTTWIGKMQDVEDLARISNMRQQYIKTYQDAIENPTSLSNLVESTKDKIVKEKKANVSRKVAKQINKVNSLKELRTIVENLNKTPAEVEAILNAEVTNNNNPFAKELLEIYKVSFNLNTLSDNATVTNIKGLDSEPELKEQALTDAKRIVSRLIAEAESIKDLDPGSELFKKILGEIAEQYVDDETLPQTYLPAVVFQVQDWFAQVEENIEKATGLAIKKEDTKSDILADDQEQEPIKQTQTDNDTNLPRLDRRGGDDAETDQETPEKNKERIRQENKENQDGQKAKNKDDHFINKEEVIVDGKKVKMYTSLVPAIREYDQDAVKVGKLIPNEEGARGKGTGPIMNFLRKAGAFKFLSNSPLIKGAHGDQKGTEIFFLVDPSFQSEKLNGEQPLFFAVKDEQGNFRIIGDVPLFHTIGKNYRGLGELRQQIKEEHSKAIKEAAAKGEDISEKPYVFSQTSSIQQTMHGTIPFGPEMRNLTDILPKNENGQFTDAWGNKIYLGVLDHGVMKSNLPQQLKDRIALPRESLKRSGGIYLLLRGLESIYYPVKLATEFFSKENFSRIFKSPELLKNNKTASAISEAVDELIEAAYTENLDRRTDAVKLLNEVLYVGNVMFSIETSTSFPANGANTIEKKVYLVINRKDSKDRNRIQVSQKLIEQAPEYTSKEKLKSTVLDALMSLNLHLQVDMRQISQSTDKNAQEYIQQAISDGLFSSELTEARIANNFFSVTGWNHEAEGKNGNKFEAGNTWITRKEYAERQKQKQEEKQNQAPPETNTPSNVKTPVLYHNINYVVDESGHVFEIVGDSEKSVLGERARTVLQVLAAYQAKDSNNSNFYYEDDNVEIAKVTNEIKRRDRKTGVVVTETIDWFYDFKNDRFIKSESSNQELYKSYQKLFTASNKKEIKGLLPTKKEHKDKVIVRELKSQKTGKVEKINTYSTVVHGQPLFVMFIENTKTLDNSGAVIGYFYKEGDFDTYPLTKIYFEDINQALDNLSNLESFSTEWDSILGTNKTETSEIPNQPQTKDESLGKIREELAKGTGEDKLDDLPGGDKLGNPTKQKTKKINPNTKVVGEKPTDAKLKDKVTTREVKTRGGTPQILNVYEIPRAASESINQAPLVAVIQKDAKNNRYIVQVFVDGHFDSSIYKAATTDLNTMVDVLTNSEEAIKQLSAWQSALEAATTERIQEGKDSKTVADQNSPEYLITLEWENLPQQIQETVQKNGFDAMAWKTQPGFRESMIIC